MMWYRYAKEESFGDKLSRLLNTNEAYDVLGEEGTWAAGGCLILGEALRRGLGDRAELMALADDHCPHQHIFVRHDGGYYDADGQSDESTLLQRWRDVERLSNPRIVPYDKEIADAHGIPSDVDRLNRLYNFLSPHLFNDN